MVIKLTKKGVLLLFSWNKKGFYDGVCNCRHDNEQACRDIGILEEKKQRGETKGSEGPESRIAYGYKIHVSAFLWI